MIHHKRRFNVGQVLSLTDLAEKLTQHTWTLCTGFEYTHKRRTFYFLNDAFSEDGAGEFAVYVDGKQVESWTASWMKPAELINDHFPTLLKAKPISADAMPGIDHPDHPCQHCA